MPRRRAPSWAAGRNRRRRLLAEFTGTGLLVAVVVGSGIAATGLTADAALRLLINSLVTALGLAVLILVFARAGGSHFNPYLRRNRSRLGARLHRRPGHRGGHRQGPGRDRPPGQRRSRRYSRSARRITLRP
jgi:hypothetical protein